MNNGIASLVLFPFLLGIIGCGNNSDVLPVADPNVDSSALILPVAEDFNSTTSLEGVDLFDLAFGYDENNQSISTINRTMLYALAGGDVIDETLAWENSSQLWSSFDQNVSAHGSISYLVWNGHKWDRISENAPLRYRYLEDGSISLIQSWDTVEMEVVNLQFERNVDLSNQSYTIPETNSSFVMPEDTASYVVKSGLTKQKIFALDDGNGSVIEDGPSMDVWDEQTHIFQQKAFPTLSSYLYSASLFDCDLGSYYHMREEGNKTIIIKGNYYPVNYEESSSFGTLIMEGTQHTYNAQGALEKSDLVSLEGASWALGSIDGLTVLETIGIQGHLNYVAIVQGSVKYLSFESSGQISQLHYLNENAIDAIMLQLTLEGKLDGADSLSF